MKLGLIGEVLGHSLSPVIHEEIFRKLGIHGTYTLIEIPRERLAGKMAELLAAMDGFNVTIPYKTAVIPFLESLSPEAAAIGAVNTVAAGADGESRGYNTDYLGFSRTLDQIGADPAGKEAVLLGTGGAARALLQCLYDRGARQILAVSRHPKRTDPSFAAFAAERHGSIVSYADIEKGNGAYLLVNATPCGMFPKTDASPLSDEAAQRFSKVVDIIYNPKETRLLAAARRGGADTANGMYMLAAQAAAAEEIWLSRAVPAALTGEIVKKLEDAL